MDARADILGGAGQRLKVDMGGDVGLPRELQRVGKAVSGDRLEGIAGVAAQVSIIDDECRAAVIADPGCDVHDFAVGPPLEDRPYWRCAYQRRQ